MQRQDRTRFESLLAKAMINEIQRNQNIKDILAEIGDKLRTEVLSSAIETINENENSNDLTPSMKEVFHSWSIKHSNEDRFLGALLPGHTQHDLLNTASGRSALLNAIIHNLSPENIKNVKTPHDVIALIKTLDDAGYYYFSDAMQKQNTNDYEIIKSIIFPTREEGEMRCPRPEAMQAMTYGIGAELNIDLIPNETSIAGCFSGKAKYFVPSTEERFKIFINKFENSLSGNDNKTQNTFSEKLNYYGIPLNRLDRELPDFYAKRYTPWFEKLSKDIQSENTLPLVSGLSSSAARLTITLLHLGVFNNTDESFDLHKAQIVLNCLMGYFVFCGHHSFLEVVEIWNRLLDYVAIYHSDKLPKNIFPIIPSNKPYIEDPIEIKLPYAEIGSYYSFLNKDYADLVIAKTKKHLEKSVSLLGIFGRECNSAVIDHHFTVNDNVSAAQFTK